MDPQVGRWVSEDPIGFAARDANLYRYVGNETTGYVDPHGLQEIRALPSVSWWRRPFIDDPQTDYVGKVPMYGWIVGNLWHRSGLDDVASQISQNMVKPIPGPTVVDIVLGAIDTVENWDKVSDLDKQDIPAQLA